MARTGTAALEWCANEVAHPSRDWYNWCLVFSRRAFGVAAKYPDATKAWQNTQFKKGTTSTPPEAVPVWWTGGSSNHGHVVVSAGNGYCYSTDILRHGKVDKVKISFITLHWGLNYRGWSEDINDVKVYTPSANVPAVDLSNVRDAIIRNYPLPKLAEQNQPDILRVEHALQAENLLDNTKPSEGFSGQVWRQAYAKWQRSTVPGPYDGIPGIRSLTLLGNKYGFRVVQ
ncbi:hypothetical protein IAD21_04216 [Abditibacteriota bacterium]|nr:hypothetical protein IAD21_04216 [Abditibacteriota bacterium]